jgi:hypothetical protein
MGSLVPATKVTTRKTQMWDRLREILHHNVTPGHKTSVDPKYRIPAATTSNTFLTGVITYILILLFRAEYV